MVRIPRYFSLLLSLVLLGPLVGFGPDAVAQTWTPAASMATPRYWHTATLLENGKVLVVGGDSGGYNFVSSPELYDPLTDTWSPAGFMPLPRFAHNASLLPNGKVLITGGKALSVTPFTSAELYDPATNTWSSAAPMHTARSSHAQILLPNGMVLVAGGNSGYGMTASAELYDPSTNTWTPAGSMAGARSDGPTLNAILLGSGKVLVTGGANTYTALATAELYDPATNSWSSADAMAEIRTGSAAALLPDGRVLVAGGAHGPYSHLVSLAGAELYDPTTNTWSSAAPMTEARDGATATLLPNGMVLVAGGWDYGAWSNHGPAELYDPSADTWLSAGSMATPRSAHRAILLQDGRALLTGGGVNLQTFASAELYKPNRPPVAVCQQSLTLTAGETCTAPVSVDGGSFDPDGDDTALDQSPPAPYTLGETAVTLTVWDVYGLSDSCTTTIHVEDLSSPVPDSDLPTVTGECSAEITSIPMATDNCDGIVAGTTSDPLSYVQQGTFTVTWVFMDSSANGDSQTQTVVVADTIPPTIDALVASPDLLWPPSHKMVSVSVSSTATDNCTPAPVCHIVSVASNEPISGQGNGDRAPDWVITGALTVDLRSERFGSGAGAGRVYTITVECTDGVGNSDSSETTVIVPHDQS